MADVPTFEVSGPLGPFAAGFVDDMRRQGFGPVAVRKHPGLVAGLSGWLMTEDLTPAGLSLEVAERFCAARRASGHTYLLTVKALDPLLGYLRELGVAPLASPQVCPGPVEELLSRFRRYLEQERGLVPAAARGYVDKVRPFVARFDAPTGLELWRVDLAEVRGFVVDVYPRLGRRSAQLTVVALRSLLRLLRLDGVIERSLADAVLRVWLAERGSPPDGPLFPTSTGNPLTRKALARRIAAHAAHAAERCPSLTAKSISPHTLRHTAAMRLLHAGVDTTVIALWVGTRAGRDHADVFARGPRHQGTRARPRQAAGQQTRPLPAARHAPRIPGWTMTRPHSPRASSAGSWSLASAPERLLRSFRSSSVTPARSSCRDCASRLKQTSGIGGRNGDIPAAAFLSPWVFARLCIRADPWRGPRGAPVANGMMVVGTNATELAVAAGAAMPADGVRRCWRW
jgi:Phage integrase family/Phage integrase, N-terminal SAM-like domain